jgi:hypothetical protein
LTSETLEDIAGKDEVVNPSVTRPKLERRPSTRFSTTLALDVVETDVAGRISPPMLPSSESKPSKSPCLLLVVMFLSRILVGTGGCVKGVNMSLRRSSTM